MFDNAYQAVGGSWFKCWVWAYTEHELNELIHQAGLAPEQAIAVKVESSSRGLLGIGLDPNASQADRLLQALGITGPIDHERLELKLDQLGYAPSAKAVILSECQMRGWLRGGGSLRLQASAAPRPTPLVDESGHPVTLRSRP